MIGLEDYWEDEDFDEFDGIDEGWEDELLNEDDAYLDELEGCDDWEAE